MIWMLIIFIGNATVWEFPIFPSATLCVQALNQLLAEAPGLTIACTPAGTEI